jgi:hypothetical protein
MAFARQSLDEARIIGRIPQRLAQLLDRRVDAVLELDEGVGRPQRLLQFFAGDNLAVTPQQ